MKTPKFFRRLLSLTLAAAMLLDGSASALFAAGADDGIASAAITATSYETIADPGTADAWQHMMGTTADGNRYAGRVWADKSVYTDGDTMVLSDQVEQQVSLAEDEEFQVVFSALGSSTTVSTETYTSSGLDVVLVLDASQSMTTNVRINGQSMTRMAATVNATNELLQDILALDDVRVAIVTYDRGSTTLLALDAYKDITLTAGRNSVSVSAVTENNRSRTASDSYEGGTEYQAGIGRGMDILANASNVSNRVPAVIALTDGGADRADRQSWENPGSNVAHPSNHQVTYGIALSTLLNAAYNKMLVEKHYDTEAYVYGVGVDMGNDQTYLNDEKTPLVIMDPANYFKENSASAVGAGAYAWYKEWLNATSSITKSETISDQGGGGGGRPSQGGSTSSYSWTFAQPSNASMKEDMTANIHYVDEYSDVSSAALSDTFTDILTQLKDYITSEVFNSIDTEIVIDGDAPLTYCDNIGEYMEVKDIQAVTLFGHEYNVTKAADGTYTIDAATGINPTTGEEWSTTGDIKITVTETNGLQTLEVKIHQEILPILLDMVNVTEDGTTFSEYPYDPLRVFYTVGIDSDILKEDGSIDLSKIASDYIGLDKTIGEIAFYCNRYGVLNPADNSGAVTNGDAHVTLNASEDNRYYFHQRNYYVYGSVKQGSGYLGESDLEAGEWGVKWFENGAYNTSYTPAKLTFADVTDGGGYGANNDENVFTIVSYYHPLAGGSANAGTGVAYLAFSSWEELAESVVFGYVTANEKPIGNESGPNEEIVYLNYENGQIVPSAATQNNDKGMPVSDMAAYLTALDAYITANDLDPDEVYAFLSIGSTRVSRLHHMTVDKTQNPTETAKVAYAPMYDADKTMHGDHVGNIAIWLGNNGVVKAQIDTGIALTKEVTETIPDVSDFAFKVTLPENSNVTQADLAVTDAAGQDLTFSYTDNTISITLPAGQTSYITGIPAGTQCTIEEVIPDDAKYILDDIAVNGQSVDAQTATVTIPSLDDNTLFVPVTFTNAPLNDGNLIISKDIVHELTLTDATAEALANKTFTFTVDVGTALAGETFTTSVSGTAVTVGADGKFTVTLHDNEAITILDLPAGTAYTITEAAVDGYELDETRTTGEEGTIAADQTNLAHFVNKYTPTEATVDLTAQGNKTFTGRAWTVDDRFTFTLQKLGDNGKYEDVEGATVTVSGSAAADEHAE